MRPGFRSWSVAAAASTLGDSITGFALGWTAAAHGPGTAGLVLVLQSVPLCVLVLPGGAVADRWGIRRTMVACDVAMVGVLLAFLLGGGSLPSLCLLALASGTAAALRRPADGAFPRLFASDEQLARALASVSLLHQVARTGGPALGGVLLAAGGLPLAIGVDLTTYVVVLLVLLRVRPPREEVSAGGVPVLQGIRAAVSAARTTGVVPLLGAVTLLGGSVLPAVVLCVPLAGQERGWGAATTGVVAGCWTVGTSGVTSAVARWGAAGARASALGPLVGALGLLLLATTRSAALGAVALGLLGVGTAAWTTTALPVFVRATPPGMLARFQALLHVSQNLAVMVALPALGWLAAAAGVRSALVVVAVVLAAVSALPVREQSPAGEVAGTDRSSTARLP